MCSPLLYLERNERVYVKRGLNVMALEANLSSASEKVIIMVTMQVINISLLEYCDPSKMYFVTVLSM